MMCAFKMLLIRSSYDRFCLCKLLLSLAVITLYTLFFKFQADIQHYLKPSTPANANASSTDLKLELQRHLHKYNASAPTNYSVAPRLLASESLEMQRSFGKVLPTFVMKHLNKTNGFFIECGAFDGQMLSNTLVLEKKYGWTGLLIEADPDVTPVLIQRNRKAWVADVCLSLQPYPMKVKMAASGDAEGFIIPQNKTLKRNRYFGNNFEVQCYPLHMILDAIGVNEVDYMSLDVEGEELSILKTIPWDRITIEMISVDMADKMGAESRWEIEGYLGTKGYKKVQAFHGSFGWLNDYMFELSV